MNRSRKTELPVKWQLMLLSAALLLFFVLSGLNSVYLLKTGDAEFASLYADRVVPLKQLKAVSDAYAVQVVDTVHKTRDGALTADQARQAIASAKQTIAREWQAYTSTDLVDQEKALIRQMEPLMAKANQAVQDIEPLLGQPDTSALAAFAAQQMYPAFDPLQDVLGHLIQTQLDVAQQAVDHHEKATRTFTGVLMTALALAVLVGAGASLWVSRHLVQTLGAEPGAVRDVARAVAQGDLSTVIRVQPGDTSSVMAAMQDMSEHLHSLVADIRGGAEHVVTASSQIAEGTQDLAHRNETQASSLEQTAAAMEQLGSTVQQSAEHAQHANQLAQNASAIAVRGGQEVGLVVETMHGIEKSSSRIGDIIGVIDGIAFQTNILALNAAVEAARAGEAGRGFAVVASEVRALAQRSAAAAKEIKDLVTDSVGQVTQGTQLVRKAGQTMEDIVSSIQTVTNIMGEIALSNQEQRDGVAQIGQAVALLDQTTQQNAALVEESAAAASSLNGQAETLMQRVARFKLS
jgi:methyl-accepting chemotaxis protein/methyl-accepting chemotaxis protein-1 (serine sensor receptor)